MQNGFAVEGWGTSGLDEHESYEGAVSRLNEIAQQAQASGWTVDTGWASRDNLAAVRLRQDGPEGPSESTIQVVRSVA